MCNNFVPNGNSEQASCPQYILPAILGPEMAAPILWAPVTFWFFLQENLQAHKIPRFFVGGGGYHGFYGCWEVPILF